MSAKNISARNTFVLLTAAAVLTACATAQENPHYQHSTKYKGDNPTTYASNTAPYSSSTVQQGNTVQADTRQVVFQQPVQDTNYSAAGYATTTHAAPSYSRVDAACIQNRAQHTPGCAPTSVAIIGQNASVAAPYAGNPQTLYVTSSTTTATSPTEQAMPDSYGTPGYEAMKNAEAGFSYQNQQTQQWEAVQTAPAPGVATPMTEPFASPLPAPSVRQARSPVTIPQSQESFTRGSQHVIQQGETVYGFARNLCSSVEEIKAMNSLDGAFKIRLGDNIRLPASKC